MSREGTEYLLPKTWMDLSRLTQTRNSRQGAKGRRGKGRSAACSSWKPRRPGEIAIAHQILHEALIGSTRGEIATASHAQGLIERLFEAKMRLLDVAVLMGNARVVPGRLHPVVPHESLVALGERFLLIGRQMPNGRAQMVGAMLSWDTADLPQRLLDALGQRLKGFAEADAHRFDIRVGEHEMVE
jgi:hypothetical protein